LDDLVVAFRQGIRRLSRKRERMGFMFDHEKQTPQTQAETVTMAA
jgi:hypothetical protein